MGLWSAILAAYVTVRSTRKVDALVKALGCDSGVTMSTILRICADIDQEVTPSASVRRVTLELEHHITLELAAAKWEHRR